MGQDLGDVRFIGFEPENALAVEVVGVNVKRKVGEIDAFFAGKVETPTGLLGWGKAKKIEGDLLQQTHQGKQYAR